MRLAWPWIKRGSLGRAATAAVVVVTAGTYAHAEPDAEKDQKQIRKDLVTLVASASYAHHRCNLYIVDIEKVKKIIADSGLDDVIKASKEDAEYGISYYTKLDSGSINNNCLTIYDQYGKNGTIIRGILSEIP